MSFDDQKVKQHLTSNRRGKLRERYTSKKLLPDEITVTIHSYCETMKLRQWIEDKPEVLFYHLTNQRHLNCRIQPQQYKRLTERLKKSGMIARSKALNRKTYQFKKEVREQIEKLAASNFTPKH